MPRPIKRLYRLITTDWIRQNRMIDRFYRRRGQMIKRFVHRRGMFSRISSSPSLTPPPPSVSYPNRDLTIEQSRAQTVSSSSSSFIIIHLFLPFLLFSFSLLSTDRTTSRDGNNHFLSGFRVQLTVTQHLPPSPPPRSTGEKGKVIHL